MSLSAVKSSLEMNSFYPSEIIPNGKIQRFNRDSQDRKKSAWYICYRNHTNSGEEYFVCVYADWRDGIRHTFTSGHSSTAEDKKKSEKQIKQASVKIEKEIQAKQEEAAVDAEEEFRSFADNGRSPYLTKKGIGHVPGLKYSETFLAVPVCDHAGKLWGFQKISDAGKFFRPGSRVKGNYFRIEGHQSLVICEGLATGISIHLATGSTVICAFSAGNIPDVARHFIGQSVTIAADQDEAGISFAQKAADLSDKFNVVIPDGNKGTDFNDIHLQHGIDRVREYFNDTREIVVDEKAAYFGQYPDATDNGKPKATIKNLRELLDRLGVIVRYNVIKKELEILIPGKSFSMDNRLEASFNHIISSCEMLGMSHGNLKGYLLTLGDENLFNPVATWITSKPWDGIHRLEDFYKTICAKDELKNGEILAMKETLIKKWLISAVAAAFEPRGVSAHGVLVLQGPQYIGKTAWVKSLAPAELEVIKDGVILKPESKDSVYSAISHWIVELGELDATFRKSDIAQLKGFLTMDKDIQRRPFSTGDSKFPRRTIFFGSVNEDDFLKDPTGNRRFWTIQCESVNYAHGLDMQQVWVEVKERFYDKKEKWVLSHDLVEALNLHNSNFEEVSSVAERIIQRFDNAWQSDSQGNNIGNWLTATEICQIIGIDNPSQSDKRSAASCLKKLFRCKKTKTNWKYFVPHYPHLPPSSASNRMYSN